jgi:predicted  nucleic acid-binding Zn-ribbon protein
MINKSIKKLQERMKKLQTQMKETETAFFVEVGRATLKWLQGTKNIAELEQKITQIKTKFGKD